MKWQDRDDVGVIDVTSGKVEKLKALVDKLMDKHTELDTKIGNMARKLENHLYEPDAHHVAMIAKKKKDKKK